MADKHPLSNLTPPKGAVKKRKRVGRGAGSNWGKTAGRGHKGQNSRAGGGVPASFEGGQMPLHMRLPKRGFTNPFRKEFVILNLADLARFEAGTVVDEALLREHGMLPGNLKAGIKILGNGELESALTVKAHKFSASAKQKIEAAGGSVEVIEAQ